jgi:hypothetical protein
MGVKGLYSYLRPYRKDLILEQTESRRIGIDALSILYKFRGNCDAILQFLSPFQKAGYSFIFIMDGKTPDAKKEEVSQRREVREEALTEANTIRSFLQSSSLDERSRGVLERKIIELEQGQGWYITYEMRKGFQEILWNKKIPCVKAQGEADELLVSLWQTGHLYSILSTDMDFLVAGVERLWIPARGSIEEVLLSEVLQKEDMNFEMFRDATILSAYKPIASAFTLLRVYASLENLSKRHANLWDLSFHKESVDSTRARFLVLPEPQYLVKPEHAETLCEELNLTMASLRIP